MAETSDPLSYFDPAIKDWFSASFGAPTRAQRESWPVIASGRSALLVAPTGSGKTLAAFLYALNALFTRPDDGTSGVRTLYISPLKALVYDIERNLRAPIVGIANAASRAGRALRPVRVDIRTGDTPARERRNQARDPAEILVTTPESLYLLLGSSAREALRSVETVIVDEIHVLAGSKRGVHLSLSLERLSSLTGRDPRRIGLSATQRPLEEIARYLGGDREVTLVDASAPPRLDMRVVVPVEDMERPVLPEGTLTQGGGGEGPFQRVGGGKPPPASAEKGPDRLSTGMWPAIYPELLALIRAHRSTILFANSRLLCERLAKRLNELAGEELVLAHHGSLSHERRALLEESLKEGKLPALVATSSLELGIDMGAVDLVVLVESPGSVASGLQRVGRSGHSVGRVSIGRLFPKYRGDLVESAVVAGEMLAGSVESTRVPKNCLDVLSQQIVAMVADRGPAEPYRVEELHAVLRRAHPYRDLTRALLGSVLDMLSGRYPSDDLSDLRPSIVWDRGEDTLTPRKGAQKLALLNGGTIPDRGLYGVFVVGDGPRLGELDEEMVYETRKGDLIVLGASTWRVEEISRDRVLVSPAPGEPGRLPFWHGERPGRPLELGRKMGAFLREVATKGSSAERWLQQAYPLDERAARNVIAYVRDQREATGEVPTDQCIVVEAFRDELGDWRVCILSPYGARVHAPWALALQSRFESRGDLSVQVMWTDDGLSLRFADIEERPPLPELFPDPEDVEELVVSQLGRSALFAARFRENAARSLLMPKRSLKGRNPLWAMRLRAQHLLAVTSRYPAFPIVLETYRECLQDVLDLPGLTEILSAVRSRAIRVSEAETKSPSPFARSLVFAYVAAFMYQGDSPLAERKAMALTLDRNLLRELLGQEDLRELLEPMAVLEVEAELQCLTPERMARSADGLHDILRRLGDLTEEEIAARCSEGAEGSARVWLDQLISARRAVPVRICGQPRVIAVEDAARYRDAAGVVLPVGLPLALLQPAPEALPALVARYARTHGPFLAAAVVERFGLPIGPVEGVLRALERDGKLLFGEIRPGGVSEEWCDPEVLKRLKRKSLALLRNQIAPVEPEVYARFLYEWHGIGADRQGLSRLREVITQLEGLPILASALEDSVLPCRVRGFDGEMLDTLGAMGEIVWVGRGARGPRDGEIALYRRDRIAHLASPPVIPEDLGPLHRSLLAHLDARGASFLAVLSQVAPERPLAEIVDALWDLAWAGLATNDTFQPLRALSDSPKRPGNAAKLAGGRWSSVRELFLGQSPSETERAYALAASLVERYGVVCASAARHEGIAGGFSSVYPVLKAMEESGHVRRGWFVDGLDGAQFAPPGSVDRLRAARERADGDPDAVVALDAADPGNPWGALLPWPERAGDSARKISARRLFGAQLLSISGRPVLFIEKGGRSMVTLGAPEPERIEHALRGWISGMRDRWKTLVIERIDGQPALDSPLREVLGRVGFIAAAGRLELPRSSDLSPARSDRAR